MTMIKSKKFLGTTATVSLLTLACLNAFAAVKSDATTEPAKEDKSLVGQYVSKGIMSGKQGNALDESGTKMKDFDRSFVIPGTPMHIRFGGYVSATYLYDLQAEADQDTIVGLGAGTLYPFVDDHIRFSASRTNFAVEVRTPVPCSDEPLKLTLITGYSPLISISAGNTREVYNRRLLANDERNVIVAAYLEMGSFLFGQYATNFMDIDSLPELLNYGGNAGAYGIAAPQIRYTYKFGECKDYAIALSLESPVTDYLLVNALQANPSNLFGLLPLPTVPPSFAPIVYWTSGIPSPELEAACNNERVPDVILSFKAQGCWGEAQLSGMARELRVYGNPITGKFINPSVIGSTMVPEGSGLPATVQPLVDARGYAWGVNLASKIMIGEHSNINGHIEYGYGLGRYALNDPTQTAWVDISRPHEMNRLHSYAGDLAFQYYWNDCWKSTALYGITRNYTDEHTPSAVNKWVESYVVNLMYAPAPIVRFGLEYISLKRALLREVPDLRLPKHGSISRIEFQARLYF